MNVVRKLDTKLLELALGCSGERGELVWQNLDHVLTVVSRWIMIPTLSAAASQGDFVANLAALLKVEIVRLAKKEVRVAVVPLKKMVSTLRNDVHALKRERSALQKEVARLSRAAPRPAASEESESVSSRARLTQAGIKSLRSRLGLSAAQLGLLVDASGQSVYKWEDGVQPRKPQMMKLIELRSAGKKQVKAMLESKASAPRSVKSRKRRS